MRSAAPSADLGQDRAGDGDRGLHAERRMVLVDHDAVEALRQMVDDLVLLVVAVVQLTRRLRIDSESGNVSRNHGYASWIAGS